VSDLIKRSNHRDSTVSFLFFKKRATCKKFSISLHKTKTKLNLKSLSQFLIMKRIICQYPATITDQNKHPTIGASAA